MAKLDKDRFQKELAIQYCLARGIAPFVEVVIPSASDLTDSVEVLTDIDVLGISFNNDGTISRTIFDCKTSNKLSPISRAFWAAGLKQYTHASEAFVILKNPAARNHRLSALRLAVDLHDESSFIQLGRTFDPNFQNDICYQSRIDRWQKLEDCYAQNPWCKQLLEILRTTATISTEPWSAFRRIIAELRAIKGNFDPDKASHIAIFYDVMVSVFVLWSVLARDIRRFYEPTMNKEVFEKTLRYYLWGGKESYQIRQQMADKASDGRTVELPAWSKLVQFSALVLDSPQSLTQCIYVCKELSLRNSNYPSPQHDAEIRKYIHNNNRVRQFTMKLSEYLTEACTLPREVSQKVEYELSIF
ncbi:hypothetical protein [Brucella anthropi]|uniref:hypothetical protein n=1 Tax=Brucella anthropi TaxID=529 RepID=UPI000CFB948F|nr:hypothetical protein [Ochrobactrum sp. MYb49]PQZ66764.1 hypothetical protein CQ057_09750 [Ochrobactrum sp. MYb49]